MITETELWERMMDGKDGGRFPYPQAFATLSRPTTFRKWRGHHATPEFNEVVIPAGTKVRVVMASRLGDVGITDDLSAASGYHYRTTCIEGELNGIDGMPPILLKPAGLLENIEMIHAEAAP